MQWKCSFFGWIAVLTAMTGCRIGFDLVGADADVGDAINDAVEGDASPVDDAGVPTNWWDSSWRQRVEIALDNTGVRESVRNFPIRLELSGEVFVEVSAATDGQDVRFIDADALTLLPHEVELWDSASQQALIWVRVPDVLGSGAADRIWLYFDNAAPDVAPADPRSVWSNEYVGVWHLAETPLEGATTADSTSNRKDGTTSGTTADDGIATPVGRGIFFDGSSHIRIPSSQSDALAIAGDSLTLEAWVRRETADDSPLPATIVGRQFGSASGDSYTMLGSAGSNTSLRFCSDNCVAGGGNDMPAGEWVYVAMAVDGTAVRAFVNGSEVASIPGSHTFRSDNNDVTIGAQENSASTDPNELWTGGIDEVRISRVARSADWIASQYRSMSGDLTTALPVESLP